MGISNQESGIQTGTPTAIFISLSLPAKPFCLRLVQDTYGL